MSKIKNVSTREVEQRFLDLRAAIEQRAAWLYLLLDEARKQGLDWDQFAQNAIRRYGVYNGHNGRFKKMKDRSSLVELSNYFGFGNGNYIFEQDRVVISEDLYEVHFHYCPLVAAWQKLGATDEEISKLCEIAMCGDRGMISTMEGMDFILEETIADGGDKCVVKVVKKK